jgi:hypothetical protein
MVEIGGHHDLPVSAQIRQAAAYLAVVVHFSRKDIVIAFRSREPQQRAQLFGCHAHIMNRFVPVLPSWFRSFNGFIEELTCYSFNTLRNGFMVYEAIVHNMPKRTIDEEKNPSVNLMLPRKPAKLGRRWQQLDIGSLIIFACSH